MFDPDLPAQGLRPTPAQMLKHLRRSNAVAQRAVALGHHPFGAVLVGPDQAWMTTEQFFEAIRENLEKAMETQAPATA